ncbi:hypothetical protein PSHT_12840 [Puccinia striiformis]|uniref:Uncharacterized protein n=1 Tax=Puccinia striiformis TaxID=27350 RepID=A0A2S4UUR4_9BASI|nr:hypothetical protein PSHT_12840 [Puccinia striiformis]
MTGSISAGQKSASLIAIEKKLIEVEARIATDRKRREAELKAAVDQARRDAESIKQMKARQKPLQSSNPDSPNPPKPIPSPSIPNSTGPAREMQMEISRELDRADFARFEREMICNEVIGARAEINIQLVDTEDRTYKTLMAERATSENVIRGLENENRDLKAERQGAQERIGSLSNELERAEKARIAAVLYAKGAEDRASAANATALAAVEVVNRQRETAPPPAPPVISTIPFWPAADDEALKNKLKERILAVEEEKLASQLASVKDEREKLVSPKKEQPNDEAGTKSPLLSAISQLVHDGLFN